MEMMMMSGDHNQQQQQLHVFFFPIMAHGHMIPTLDLAKLFASRAAVKSTIITTPLNQPLLSKAIHKYAQLGLQIGTLSLHFPGVDVGLPEDCQHFDQITSDDAASRFFRACAMLRGPLEQLLEEHRPDCLVADPFFPWATAAAAKFGIPRLIFDGTNYVSSCAMHSLRTHRCLANFTDSQLREMAAGIEASGQEFIWVIRKTGKGTGEEEEWMPEGFEERTKGKGLIIRGWAPQVLILDHVAVGAFVTHCGWNSTLEGVCAGVPMVTWPVFAEQFINEKLVTDILGTGVGVGSKEWKHTGSDGVKGGAVADAIKRAMESEEMRSRAKALKEKAREAVEEGGSSHSSLNHLLHELRAYPRKGGSLL